MFLIGRNKKGGRLAAVCITLHERYTQQALGTLADLAHGVMQAGGIPETRQTLSLQVLI